MILLTDLHANLKTGVHLTDIGPLCWTTGWNASGKSAVLQAVELLISKRASDVRGKDIAEASALRSLQSPVEAMASTDADASPDSVPPAPAALSIDAIFSDGRAAAAAFGVGRPACSWPAGMLHADFSLNDKPVGWTHLSRLTYSGFLAASVDTAAALLIRLVGSAQDIAAVDALEAAEATRKALTAKIKEKGFEREILRNRRFMDLVEALDAELDADLAELANAEAKVRAAGAAVQAAAAALSVTLDARSAASSAFPRLRAKFGLPMLAGHISDGASAGFGRATGCPQLGLLKPDVGRVDFAMSGAEEAFCCLWLAHQLVEINQTSAESPTEAPIKPRAELPYRCFLFPDRSYDSQFVQCLREDVAEMHANDSLHFQIFGASSL